MVVEGDGDVVLLGELGDSASHRLPCREVLRIRHFTSNRACAHYLCDLEAVFNVIISLFRAADAAELDDMGLDAGRIVLLADGLEVFEIDSLAPCVNLSLLLLGHLPGQLVHRRSGVKFKVVAHELHLSQSRCLHVFKRLIDADRHRAVGIGDHADRDPLIYGTGAAAAERACASACGKRRALKQECSSVYHLLFLSFCLKSFCGCK